MRRYSLYDNYRLSNSTQVPRHICTSAPVAVQVGAHLQGLYDTARTGGYELFDATGNLQSLEQDRRLENEVRDKITTSIDKMASEKDWENKVEDVRSLGRNFVQRARELGAPVQQYQKWKEGLEDKDLNLTPEQKQILDARSRAGYKGLKKDPLGRFIGSFSGVDPAKNIDVSKKVDTWMQSFAVAEGGSDIMNDNGYWKIKKGNKWEVVDAGRIQSALNMAMANDQEYQSYTNMMGENAGFMATKKIHSLDQLNASTRPKVEALMKQGYTLQQASGLELGELQKRQITNTAKGYAVTKYAKNNRWTESGTEIGAIAVHDATTKAEDDLGIFADTVTDAGIDVSKKYGTPEKIEETYTAASAGLTAAEGTVASIRGRVASAMKVKPDEVKEADINKWFNDNPAEQGKYKSAKASMQAHKGTLAEINALQSDAMNLASVKSKGVEYSGIKEKANVEFQAAIASEKLNIKLPGGKVLNSATAGNYEVVDGDKGFGRDVNYITVLDKTTGAKHKIFTARPDSPTAEGMTDSKGLSNVGGNFDGIDWKSTWKEAATNIRSNSVVMPLMDLTTPDGKLTKSGAFSKRMAAVLRGGAQGLEIADADQNGLDADDQDLMRQRISAGEFTVTGLTKRQNGKTWLKATVVVDKEASDPAEQRKTVLIAADTNMGAKLGRLIQEQGIKDNDSRTFQFGSAVVPGSSYEQVLDLGPTGRLTVEQKPSGLWKSGSKASKSSRPVYEVVTNITGSAGDAVSYEVYKLDGDKRVKTEQTFNDAFDLGAWLDTLKQSGMDVKKNNKR